MSRSHPPSLIKLAERTLRDEASIARGDRILAACSGGPDSTAMLDVLARLRRPLGFELVAHGVDHGLRSEAASELDLARRRAEAIGVPFEITRVPLEAGPNLQARARAVRFAALSAAAARSGATLLATGHTADDRAETFLLRLLRGAGPRGLAVLPVRAAHAGGPDRIRPLLRARRADVLVHLARHAIAFAEDPSNLDPRFSRVRVRRELIPLLEELGPGVVEHLGALADMLARAGGGADPPSPEDGLGRAQRQAIDRARRLGRPSLRIRGPHGRDLDVTFPLGEPVVIEPQNPAGPRLVRLPSSKAHGRNKT